MVHVLVIEDDYFIATRIAEVITSLGMTAALAPTQPRAIAAALERKPAIILSDVRLSEGTGPGAVMAIRAIHGPIPVVFITGSPEECDPCIDAVVILAKPLIANVLVKVIQQLMHSDTERVASVPAGAQGTLLAAAIPTFEQPENRNRPVGR